MRKNSLYFRHSEQGFSLVEITATLLAAVVFSIGAAMVVVQAKRIEVSSDFQASLDMTHILAMQKLRNMTNLSAALNISTSPCFGKAGTGCTSAISPMEGAVPPLFSGDQNNNACIGGGSSGTSPYGGGYSYSSGSDCLINYSITYAAICDSTRCDRIEFTITTLPGPKAYQQKLVGRTRVTKITIPGFMFANRTAINFSCASSTSAIPLSIDYRNLTMGCSGPDSSGRTTTCDSNMPASGFNVGQANCQTGENKACPTGVQVAGLFQGQTSCN